MFTAYNPGSEDRSLPAIIPLKIQGITLWAYLDTGSGRNFISREAMNDFPVIGDLVMRTGLWDRQGANIGNGYKEMYGVDCKTVGFFLKISKEIGKAWRKSLTRAKRASLTRP